MKLVLSPVIITFAIIFNAAGVSEKNEEPSKADVIVYGGTPAGIAAAVQTSRMGHSVILVCPEQYLGGLMTGGLGASDKGVTWTVGGLSLEFFQRVYNYYLNADAWKSETRADWVPKHGQTTKEIYKSQYYFEPHVAGKIFREMLSEANVPVVMHERLNREDGVIKDGPTIEEIVMENGRKFSGKYFIDATYEGDLMAAAGVDYIVGREPNSRYGETLNGIRFNDKGRMSGDPYIVPGNPESGLLPRIQSQSPGKEGDGDGWTQAYNFRMCLTDLPENRVPFTKPENYNPLEYELMLRAAQARAERDNLSETRLFFTRTPMPNNKTDSNNTGPISTDYVGANHAWPEASYAEREKMLAEHKTYVQGFFYFLANDPRVPEALRNEVSRWGLAKDEFVDNDNWPTQLYVREARRMVGDFVMNERHFARKARVDGKIEVTPAPEVIEDSIAVGSYALDSHAVSMFVDPEGVLFVEGGFYAGVMPYPISFRVLLPKPSQVDNLLVPVAVSASHVAFGTLRMEPVFMEMGQAAATAIGLALDQGISVHELPYPQLRERLLKDRAVLDPEEPVIQKVSFIQDDEVLAETMENTEEGGASPKTLGAIQTLTDAGVISDPQYWIDNANAGSSCDGLMVAELLVACAAQLDPSVTDVHSAVQKLTEQGLLQNEEYWLARTAKEAKCPGGFVAAFLVKFSTRFQKAT